MEINITIQNPNNYEKQTETIYPFLPQCFEQIFLVRIRCLERLKYLEEEYV